MSDQYTCWGHLHLYPTQLVYEVGLLALRSQATGICATRLEHFTEKFRNQIHFSNVEISQSMKKLKKSDFFLSLYEFLINFIEMRIKCTTMSKILKFDSNTNVGKMLKIS